MGRAERQGTAGDVAHGAGSMMDELDEIRADGHVERVALYGAESVETDWDFVPVVDAVSPAGSQVAL